MKRLSGIATLLLAGFGALTFAAKAHAEDLIVDLPGEYLEGDFSQGEYEKELSRLYQSLVMDYDLLDGDSTLVFHPDPNELQKLGKKSETPLDDTGTTRNLELVGVNGTVNRVVDFNNVTVSSIPAKPIALQGGIARRLSSGELVWTLGVESPDAGGLRLQFEGFVLPAGVELYWYNQTGEIHGPYTSLGPNNDGAFWSNSIRGDIAFLELRSVGPITDVQLAGISFSINGVAHLDDSLFPDQNKGCTFNAECVVDARCITPADWGQIENTRRAIAHMVFDAGGFQAICSGGLLRDNVADSQIPYFLTANHCLSTQVSASSLETFWNFETPSCDAECPDPSTFPRRLGSTLMRTAAVTDYTLLRLNNNPPPGAFFLGYNTTPIATTAGVNLFRVSHPLGAPQMFTRSVVDPTFTLCNAVLPTGNFIYADNIIGTNQGGSSGSPVLNENGQVVGQLFGICGTEIANVCSDVNRAVDGAFAVTYRLIAEILDPPEPPELPYPSEWYLPEGVTTEGFETYVLIGNPNNYTADVELQLLTQSNTNEIVNLQLAPRTRSTIRLNDFVNDAVSTIVREKEGRGITVERSVYAREDTTWFGAHTVPGITQRSDSWYFPEGASVQAGPANSPFETYFLVTNPTPSPVEIEMVFYGASSIPFKRYATVPANRRFTALANGAFDSRLENASFSTRITAVNGEAILAERAMWWRASNWRQNQFMEGHGSAGLTSLSREWYLAEGDTQGFAEFLLITNPNNEAVTVNITYMRQAADPEFREFTLDGNARKTINVMFDPEGLGIATKHGTKVTATGDIAVERSMYADSGAYGWKLGHNSTASPVTARAWALTEGATVPISYGKLRTFILIANPNEATAATKVTYLMPDGTFVIKNYNVGPNRRLTLAAQDEVQLQDKAFSTVVTCNVPIVVERSMYWDINKPEVIINAGGTCAMGFPTTIPVTTTKANEAVDEPTLFERLFTPLPRIPATPVLATPTPTPTLTPTPIVP